MFENSPWVAERAWAARPFGSLDALFAAMADAVERAPREVRMALIRAHPDLVGGAALSGTLTRESTGEQAAAGLDAGALTAGEIAAFTRNNAAYRERFGFPFVICARENKKESIVAGFASRLPNSREEEIRTALREIEKIAWYRLADVVAGDDALAVVEE